MSDTPAHANSWATTLNATHLDSVLTLDADTGAAEIDLSRVSFVDAYALTGLACFIASADRDGLSVELVLPEHPDVRSWLSRTLIELQRFDDSHGSHRLASFIWDRLEGGADGEVVNQLFEATGELGQNVVEHAGSPVGGFVAAQRYKAGAPEERIIVAVGDAGIGIRESLRPRYGDMTDRQAITQAIRWNVSRVLEPGRGQGLPGVVDGVRGLGGVVWIRSGAASRTITRGRATTVDVSRLQGTIVGARLPCRPGGVTREEARSNAVDTHRPEAGVQP